MDSDRIVVESPVTQGPNERRIYRFNFALQGTPIVPVTTEIFLKNKPTEDLSSTLLDGNTTIEGDKVVTPIVKGLTSKKAYLLRATATIGPETSSAVCEIHTDLV